MEFLNFKPTYNRLAKSPGLLSGVSKRLPEDVGAGVLHLQRSMTLPARLLRPSISTRFPRSEGVRCCRWFGLCQTAFLLRVPKLRG